MGANTFAMPRSIKSRENKKTGDKRAKAVLGRREPWLLLTCAAMPRLQGVMLMSFSHEDVQRLLQLLDCSQFDELQLEAEGIKLSLRRNGAGSNCTPSASSAAPVALPRVLPAAAPAAPVQPAPTPSSDPSLLEIRAPMLGTFYGAPKPGAEPFVTVGGRVDSNTAVGIIEVMKLMNSISAGLVGVVVEVLARDGDLVEFDQVLMRVRPE